MYVYIYIVIIQLGQFGFSWGVKSETKWDPSLDILMAAFHTTFAGQ